MDAASELVVFVRVVVVVGGGVLVVVVARNGDAGFDGSDCGGVGGGGVGLWSKLNNRISHQINEERRKGA
jgi:hypothetical protein